MIESDRVTLVLNCLVEEAWAKLVVCGGVSCIEKMVPMGEKKRYKEESYFLLPYTFILFSKEPTAQDCPMNYYSLS